MTRATVDASLHVVLPHIDSSFEFCDESGRRLGYFVPAPERLSDLYAWARHEFGEEEIAAARGEPTGPTTADVLRRLADR